MALSVLIINADDFGYSLTANQAILRSFERKFVNSTSLMANMAGFDDAINMVNRNTVLQGRVGVHLNLTEGYPVTRLLHGLPAFCDDDGRLVYDRRKALIHLGRKEKDGLYGELKAQLEKVLSAGIRPTHLDSHHHVHTEWAIAPLVCRLAREYGIRRIRLTRNIGPIAITSGVFISAYIIVGILAGIPALPILTTSGISRTSVVTRRLTGGALLCFCPDDLTK
jgi:predicted glycoside hydrolase/deacetylase ChbG (UPF0249 family)